MKCLPTRLKCLLAFVVAGTSLYLVELKAQVFTPFVIGNNPPLVSPRPQIIQQVTINGTPVISQLDGFQTQSGDVWYDWEAASAVTADEGGSQ